MDGNATEGVFVLAIYLDCRVFASSSAAFDTLRHELYSQCSTLLDLRIIRGLYGKGFRLNISLVQADAVLAYDQPYDASRHDARQQLSDAVANLQRLRTAAPSIVSERSYSVMVNRFALVAGDLAESMAQRAARSHVLFASAFVSVEEVTSALQGLRPRPSQDRKLSCLLTDPRAACETVAEDRHLHLYRCATNRLQMRSVLQRILTPVLLPCATPPRRVKLDLGPVTLHCTATKAHHCDAIRRCCTVDDFAAAGGAQRGDFFSGALVQNCVTERRRGDPARAAEDSRDADVELRAAAVLPADQLDPAFLFGDTWVLSLDERAPVTLVPRVDGSEPLPFFYWAAFCAAFQSSALLVSGDEYSALSRCHLAMPRQHYAVTVFNRTLRLRAVAPSELSATMGFSLPSRPTPAVGTLRAVFDEVRSALEVAARSPDFDMETQLSVNLGQLAREVRPASQPPWQCSRLFPS